MLFKDNVYSISDNPYAGNNLLLIFLYIYLVKLYSFNQRNYYKTILINL